MHKLASPRDLKLDNCLLSSGISEQIRTCKLADFGLHKRARHSKARPGMLTQNSEGGTLHPSNHGSSNNPTRHDDK